MMEQHRIKYTKELGKSKMRFEWSWWDWTQSKQNVNLAIKESEVYLGKRRRWICRQSPSINKVENLSLGEGGALLCPVLNLVYILLTITLIHLLPSCTQRDVRYLIERAPDCIGQLFVSGKANCVLKGRGILFPHSSPFSLPLPLLCTTAWDSGLVVTLSRLTDLSGSNFFLTCGWIKFRTNLRFNSADVQDWGPGQRQRDRAVKVLALNSVL